MSTKQLSITGMKPVGLTMDSFPIYNVNGSLKYEEYKTTANVSSLSPPYASNCRVDLDIAHDDVYTINEHFLEWTITNASGTEAPTFLNIWATIQEAKILFNNKLIDHVVQRSDILCRVSNHLREHADHIPQALSRMRNENANTYGGETCAVSSTLKVSLPLTVIFPFLKNLPITPNTGLKRITYQFTFTQNYSDAANNTLFVKSNTTSNAYSTNLTYSSLEVRQCIVRPNSQAASLTMARVAPKLLRVAHETRITSCSWNTINTDNQKFNMRTLWSPYNNVRGIYVYIENPAARTAYNDTNSGEYFSGPAYIGYKLLHNQKILVDHSDSVGDLKKRRDYCQMTQQNMWSKSFPLEALSASNALTNYYLFMTYIDLTNIEVFDQHEMAITNINSSTENLSIELYCAGAISSAVNLYTTLEYVQEISNDGKGNYNTPSLQ